MDRQTLIQLEEICDQLEEILSSLDSYPWVYNPLAKVVWLLQRLIEGAQE